VPDLDPAEIVRVQLAAGKSTEEIVAHLISAGVSPFAAINALRNVAQISLRAAKTCVDHSFSLEAQEANERLRDMAESVAMLADAMDHARCTAPRCPAPAHLFVVYLADPGQGFHAIAPLHVGGGLRRPLRGCRGAGAGIVVRVAGAGAGPRGAGLRSPGLVLRELGAEHRAEGAFGGHATR
jgi:hypothetical protein